MKKRWGDISGAVGDLGVMLPLLAGLSLFNGIPFALTLGMVGLVYVVSSLVFRLPVPVQPLKVACSLALSLGLGRSVLMAASWEVGLVLLLVGFSGLAERLVRLFEKSTLRGMQLGVGLILIQGAWALWNKGMKAPVDAIPAAPWDWPAGMEWGLAFTVLVVPQIPVTLSNAVVGSADAARRYFRWKAAGVTASRLCLSMGLSNLAMAAAGGIPVCHGSSGWTAHRRMGARTFRATLGLGLVFLLLAAGAGRHAAAFLSAIPVPFLAALLAYVGLRHAMLVWDVRGHKPSFFMALGVGLLSWWTKNPSVGVAAGLAGQVLMRRGSSRAVPIR